MQQADVTVDGTNLEWIHTDGVPRQPAFRLTYNGGAEKLRETFTAPEGELYPSESLDVWVRFQRTPNPGDEPVVLSLAHRVTGELLLETRTDGGVVADVVEAVNRNSEIVGADQSYAIQLRSQRELVATYEKRTLLIYDSDGTLLRYRSLIPREIEI